MSKYKRAKACVGRIFVLTKHPQDNDPALYAQITGVEYLPQFKTRAEEVVGLPFDQYPDEIRNAPRVWGWGRFPNFYDNKHLCFKIQVLDVNFEPANGYFYKDFDSKEQYFKYPQYYKVPRRLKVLEFVR